MASGGVKGFKIKVRCSVSITVGTLIFPGTSYRPIRYRGTFGAGSTYTLITLKMPDWEGQVFHFEGSYAGSTRRVASPPVKAYKAPPVSAGALPCTIILDDDGGRMKLSSGEAGYKLKIRCDSPVSDPELSFPGSNFRPIKYSNAFAAGSTYTLLSLKKQEWAGKSFKFEAAFDGKRGSTSTDAMSAPQSASDCKTEADPTTTPEAQRTACQKAMLWGRDVGVRGHPEWYPGLSPSSSFYDFQRVMSTASNTQGCVKPC